MATSSTPSPNAGNRFARYTPEDHSATIWISSLLALIFTYLILIVRLGFVKLRIYGLDDLLLIVAHLVGMGMWGTLFSSLNKGLGQTLMNLSPTDIAAMNESYFTSRILFVIALCFSKCSILVFIQSIFDYMRNVSLTAIITMVIIVASGISGALALSVGCSPDHIMSPQENYHCGNDILRLQVFTICDVITEMMIILLPIMPLRTLRMPRKRKLLVMLAFTFRIPNIIFSVMHLITYAHFIREGHRGVAISTPVVWQNVLLSYNFMSATVPALKGFMSRFTTGGMGYTGDVSTAGTGGTGSGSSYKLQSISKSKTKASLVPQGYPKSATHISSVPPPPKRLPLGTVRRLKEGSSDEVQEIVSIASHDSQKIMIRKDWEISRA